MISVELKKRIRDIIPDDYWDPDIGKTYDDAASRLHEIGMAEDEIVTFLNKLYCETAGCFGI